MNTDVMFSSKTDLWSTPQDFFDKLNAKYAFTLDVCADESNAKCANYFSKEQDGLKQEWTGRCWMNPPYSDLSTWIEKAFNESLKGTKVVCLIPARTDTACFHKYIFPYCGLNSSDYKYAYVAGIIDGEGCIRVDKKNPTEANRLCNPVYNLKLSVKMTDKTLISMLMDSFGGSISIEYFKDKKDTFKWEVGGEHAYHVLTLVYPYLKIKKSQAFYGIQFQHLKQSKEGKKLNLDYLSKCQEYYQILTNLKVDDNLPSIIVSIEFLKGRLKFGDSKNSAPFPSMVVVFG